jgi:hypothetical protein
LPSIAHFLQQKLHFLYAIEGCTVFFVVKFEWLKKPKYGDAAFMMDNVAHCGAKVKKGRLVFKGLERIKLALAYCFTKRATRHASPAFLALTT